MGARTVTTRLSIQVSRRLKELREKRGLVQADVAKKLRMKTQAYGSYERYAGNPKAETPVSVERLGQLAALLEVPIGYFIDAEKHELTLDGEAGRLFAKLSEEDKTRVIGMMRLFLEGKR